MFVPGIMASRLNLPATPVVETMDMEDSDPDSYLPFFDWQSGSFEQMTPFLVLDNGAKNNTAQAGSFFLRVGKQYSYASLGITQRDIRFSIPVGATDASLSIWYKRFKAANDNMSISVVQYPDGTYTGADSTDIIASLSGAGNFRDYTWTEATSTLVGGKFYELVLIYDFKTINDNFPSDQRPTVGGVYDATHNMGECLPVDSLSVSYVP